MKDDVSQLRSWYARHARQLPWRYGGRYGGRYNKSGKKHPNPYHVWLSEIMLQQTVVASVIPYFETFITRYPTLGDLANAEDNAVMAAWAGLGYYQRARNMLKCARLVMSAHGGAFPTTEAELLKLPGIGAYTAAAIAAIAFNRAATPIDGNIERVLARRFALTTPLPALKAEVKVKAQSLLALLSPVQAQKYAGDVAQAMMDLGAGICTPKRPHCTACPWAHSCLAHAQGIAETLPHRPPKPAKPTRRGTIYWLENTRGGVLMMRRAPRGLLGGMACFPSRGWDKNNDTDLPMRLPDDWRLSRGQVAHVFTHFNLQLRVQKRIAPKGFRARAPYFWCAPKDFAGEALPSLMRKVAAFVSPPN